MGDPPDGLRERYCPPNQTASSLVRGLQGQVVRGHFPVAYRLESAIEPPSSGRHLVILGQPDATLPWAWEMCHLAEPTR